MAASQSQGSFRGVPFHTRAHDGTFGRRVQVHEYPLRDKPYAEDLGRRARTMSLDAFVLGDDYQVTRDRLLAAIEAAGPGKLEHPYLGEMQVTITSCKLGESTAEGGMARFQLEFVEAGSELFPASGPSAVADVNAKADAAVKSVQASFAKRSSVANKPQFVTAASASIYTRALNGMTAAVGRVRGVANEVAVLQKGVDAAKRDLTTLLFQPASAAQTLLANFKQLVRSVTNAPREALNLARVFYRFSADLPPVTASTTSRAAQARNQAELLQLVRVAAVSEGARAAARLTFDSYQDAIAVRDELVAAMDDLMVAASTDDVYDTLRTLRAAAVRDIATRGADLVRLVAWTPRATMPLQLVAQELYADATRADELLTRNGIRHPLFVPGAVPLEVLSDAA